MHTHSGIFCVVFVQSLSCVWLFETSWAAACQAPLSSIISCSLLRFMSIESVMPSNYLNCCHPLLFFGVCNGILLGHKKEWNSAICRNLDGPRDYHTKWSQTEKDRCRMISLKCGILKKWYKWTYLQNRKRLTNLEKQIYGYQRGQLCVWGGVGDKLGDWD